MDDKMNSKVELITPPNKIKEKVGSGGIDRDALKQAETNMTLNEKDFLPIIDEHMDRIALALQDTKRKPQDVILDLTSSVYLLKSKGGMYNYPLISDVSSLILNFLPRVERIDADILEIIAAYQVTVRAIITRTLRGPKTAEGQSLITALEHACQRYYKQHFIKT